MLILQAADNRGLKCLNVLAMRKVTVKTDHKLLETVFKKPLLSAPLRLQRMLMQLQSYDLSVVYKKGSELYIADRLSRAYLNESSSDLEGKHEVLMLIPIAPPKIKHLKQETATDPVLQKLTQTLSDGQSTSKMYTLMRGLNSALEFSCLYMMELSSKVRRL